MTASSRPTFLNLLQIGMPVGALTSIGHRISGVVLAVCVPAGVYLLALSVQDAQGFAQATGLFRHGAVKVAVAVAAWALAHHVLAGVRHMLTDFNVGSTLHTARRTAWSVNVGGVAVVVLVIAFLL